MKQRIVAILLTICILCSIPVSVFAEGEETETAPPSYYRITANISDIEGYTMELDFMIPGDEKGVYVNAEQLAELTGVSGYAYDQTYQQCAYVNKETKHVVLFQFGSTNTAVYYLGCQQSYEAPMPSLYQDGVAWVPFDFAMQLFHCYYQFFDQTLSIQSSQLTPLTAISAVYNDRDTLSFDWVDEVGYSSFDVAVMSGSASTVNFLNGLLKFEASSWGTLLTCLVGSSYPYDKEYAEDIAQMFIAPSQSEMEGSVIENTQSVVDFFAKGVDSTGSITSIVDKKLATGDVVGAYKDLIASFPQLQKNEFLKKQIAAIEKGDKLLKKGNGFFSKIADKFSTVKDTDLNKLEVLFNLIGVCDYYIKFSNKSDHAVSAMKLYAQYSEREESAIFPDYVENLETPWVGALEQYLKDNMDSIVSASIPFDKLLGGPATFTLIGWDIVSNTVPYFKDGFDSTENFERSEYAIIYQDEAAELIDEMRAECLSKSGIKENKIKDMVNSTYAYLKFSIIARNSGAASMKTGKLEESVKEVKLDQMEKKNATLGKYLAVLEEEDYGFLPSENKTYLKEWDDSLFITFLKGAAESIEASYQSTQPKSEITDFPGDTEKVITEEEAIELVKNAVGQSFSGLFDSLFADIYTFRVTESYYIWEESVQVYVVQMLVEEQEDAYRFFVPLDGEHVWMGQINSDGTYLCYTQIDLLDLSLGSLVSSMSELYKEVQEEEAG